jgi:beta-N-acetylhexosaminidase
MVTMKNSGRRFIFGFTGTTINPQVEELIVKKGLAGVIIFSRNVEVREQLTFLCAELRALRARVSEYPLIIAVDHEGGYVHRLGGCATRFPSPMAIAATGNVEHARSVGYCMGRQLLSLGINMNIAPVLDVNTNRENPIIGVRSFSDDPEKVAAFGAAMIGGMQRAGVASVAKHFPGLGFAGKDAHIESPVIAKHTGEVERQDIVPFAKAVEAGVCGVMVGHARYPSISARPASLSSKIIDDLLRKRLDFGGLVITDDLEMGAITERRTVGSAAVKAYEAGADLILVGHSRGKQFMAMENLGAVLRERRISRGGRKERLLRFYSFLKGTQKNGEASENSLMEEGEALAREIAEQAVTVVSDENAILPLRIGEGDTILLVYPELGPLTAVEDEGVLTADLPELVRARHLKTETVRFAIVPSKLSFDEIERALPKAAIVVMATCNAHLYGEQERLVRKVTASGRPAVFIALRNPYDVKLYPPNSARLAAFGSDPHTVVALSRLLFGEIKPRGRSPVSLG